MSPASGDSLAALTQLEVRGCSFHSINVPSEWGQLFVGIFSEKGEKVSIQLMSPASGDGPYTLELNTTDLEFPFN